MAERIFDGTDPHSYEPHIGGSRQYMRDIILGVNDGLVSTFLLVSGVMGEILSRITSGGSLRKMALLNELLIFLPSVPASFGTSVRRI